MKTPYYELGDMDFQNNLDFSLYAILVACYIVITSEDKTKSEENKC